MMTLIAAALAAAQPAPATSAPTQPRQMEHEGMMGDMMGTGHMTQRQMADCHKCCEEMMARMHRGHAQHKGHAG